MELAYRLAVDESALHQIDSRQHGHADHAGGRSRRPRSHGRRLQLASGAPGQNWPPLVYWGHYVAHDNNRDAMGLSLKLTRNMLNTYISAGNRRCCTTCTNRCRIFTTTRSAMGHTTPGSIRFSTDEWQMIGWNNVSEMTKFGMPGVFAHGNFDTWSPGYLMFIAATHNGISRLYETFGNGGADTVERTLSPDEYSRTWYKQNPPLPKAKWSQRNNNNYEQTGAADLAPLLQQQQQAVPAGISI